MPIFRKGHSTIHFADIPGTDGRSILEAMQKSGWAIERFVDWDKHTIFPYLTYDQIKDRGDQTVSFAVVRDPIDRLIASVRLSGLCEDQEDLCVFLSENSEPPETHEKYFDLQTRFMGPHTIVYRYEDEYEDCIRALKLGGYINLDLDVPLLSCGSKQFDVDKDEIRKDLMRARKWYLDDYRRLGYMPSKS